MKAAIVYHFFPHYRAAVLRELQRSTEHDYLLVADDRSVEPSIRKWDVQDRTRFLLAPCRALIAPFLYQRGLIGLALRRDLDALIYLGNPYFVSTWLSALLARLTHKRVLFWTHGWTRSETGVKAWLRWTFYKLADGLLLYGHMAKMTGLAKGFAPEKLHVIYNSLDYESQKKARASITPEKLSALREQLFREPGRPVVICCARLTHLCRLDLLLEAQAKLKQEGHLINVLLVGDGPDRQALETLATRLEVPVRFYGACYDEVTLAGLTMAANVSVSPGKIGLTAMQSLAFGTPVITHDDFEAQMPEWEAILPGRTGDFFKRDDVADLARVIRGWTGTSFTDPAVRNDCFKVIEQFYNPSFQCRAIDRAVRGCEADDLFWIKESAGAGC